MNTAIFGGSFNPIHLGHIKLLKAAFEIANLDRAILIPTGYTPHKSNDYMVSSEHRFAMCKLASENMDNISVSDIEIRRPGKSYTYITLNSLKEKYPFDCFYLIVGADMYLTLQSWKNSAKLLKGLNVITSLRDSSNYDDMLSQSKLLEKYDAKSYIIDRKVMDVSSTEIRNRLKNNVDVSDLIDKKVFEYIKINHLYGT